MAALIEGSESEHNMFVILLSTHLCANTRSQLEHIARGLKYAKLRCFSGDRDPNPACQPLITSMPKKEFIKRGASWVHGSSNEAWLREAQATGTDRFCLEARRRRLGREAADGGLHMPWQEPEWRSRPYILCVAKGTTCATWQRKSGRKDIWASGRFRGGRSEGVEWPGDFSPTPRFHPRPTPLHPCHPSPPIW